MKYYPHIPPQNAWVHESIMLDPTKLRYYCDYAADLRPYNLNKDYIILQGEELTINTSGKLIGDPI